MAEKPDLIEERLASKPSVIRSNEEIIEEVTKGLDSVLINGSKESSVEEDIASIPSHEAEHIPKDFQKTDGKPKSEIDEDFIDDEALKDAEVTYTEDDKERLREEAEKEKFNGNDQFKTGNYRESALSYTHALRTCPLAYSKDRAILYSNRAAAKMKLGLNPGAIEDCTKAIELDSTYLKAFFRRAQMLEESDKLDEALADYQTILGLDPLHREALYATKRLPEKIQERNEKLKTEMLSKLKDLGNMILRPFNLSTDNFQLTQDPNSGGYSVNFQQTSK